MCNNSCIQLHAQLPFFPYVQACWALVFCEQFLFSSDAGDELKRTLAGKDQELVLVYEDNLVDKVWGKARPNPPLAPLRVHELQYAGMKVATKLANLHKELVDAGATAIVITMLDEVAWLLNLVCMLSFEQLRACLAPLCDHSEIVLSILL